MSWTWRCGWYNSNTHTHEVCVPVCQPFTGYRQINNSYLCTGTSCNENFQTGFVVVGGGFLFYCIYQLIKFEEEKRFGLWKQFCNYEKRNIFENFPWEFFPCKMSLCRYLAYTSRDGRKAYVTLLIYENSLQRKNILIKKKPRYAYDYLFENNLSLFTISLKERRARKKINIGVQNLHNRFNHRIRV